MAAATTPKPASTRKQPPLPHPIELANIDHDKKPGHFWAASLLNSSNELLAIQLLREKAPKTDITTRRALGSASFAIREDVETAEKYCLESGGLLFAFQGSKAFQGAA